MKRSLYYFLIATILSFVAHADEDNQEDLSRIQKLIPNTWIEYPAIEPSIPSDYVMKQGSDGNTIYWGAESDLENGEKIETSNNTMPLFVIKHSLERQTGPDSFSFEKQNLIKEFSKAGLQVVRAGHGRWGEYPIFHYEGKSPSKEVVRSVWVGLNSPEQWVMVVSMAPTNNKMNDERVWNRFINNTKQLTGYEYLRAMGSDMQNGRTVYTCAMGEVEAKVQQRRKDKKLAIQVSPLNENTTFNIQKTVQATMMGPWRHGDRITKIYGTMVYEDGHYSNVVNSVINVFIEEVSEFTFNSK